MAKKESQANLGSNLYERYRPSKFSEVIGHKEAVAGLSRIASSDNPMHAIGLFGPRGGGKTTLGRILGARLNCENPDGVEPCGKCKECKAALNPQSGGGQGSFREMDGSRLGKDGVADLAKSVAIQTLANYKIILIDEAHMITKDAGAALLKLVEEPPARTIFILCTTDEQRLLPALRSRMQKVQLNSLDTKLIAGGVAKIAKKEGIKASKDDILNIASGATGSMREALVRLGNFRDGIPIDSTTITDDLVDAMVDDNLGEAFSVLTQAGTSVNVHAVAEEIRESYRTALILKSSKNAGAVLMEGMPEGRREQTIALSELTTGEITLGIRAFSEALMLMRGSGSTNALLELAITQTLSPDERASIKMLGDLMDEFLDVMETGGFKKMVREAVRESMSNAGWAAESPESEREDAPEEEDAEDLPGGESADSGADSDESEEDDPEDEDWEDEEPEEDPDSEDDEDEGEDEDPDEAEDEFEDEEEEEEDWEEDPEGSDEEDSEDWDEDEDEEDWEDGDDSEEPEEDSDLDEGDPEDDEDEDEDEEDWEEDPDPEDDEDWDEDSDDPEEEPEEDDFDDEDDFEEGEEEDEEWEDEEEGDDDDLPDLDALLAKALELPKSKSKVKEKHLKNAYLQWADDGEGEHFFLVFRSPIKNDSMVKALEAVMQKAVDDLGYDLTFEVDFD